MSISTRAVRTLAIAFVLTDAVALGSFAVRVHEVSTTVTAQPASPAGPTTSPTTAPATHPAVPRAGSATLGSTAISPGSGAHLSTVTINKPGHTVTTPTHHGGSTTGNPTGSGTTARSIAACPIKLTDSNQSGGLQSLVEFAPAFGPFTPEAFGAASAYQPALELIGPLLAQYPRLAPVIGPYAAKFVLASSQATGLLGQALNPLYGPYKNQVVTSETKLAAALAPYVEGLAYSPLGGCAVALENALVAQAKSS